MKHTKLFFALGAKVIGSKVNNELEQLRHVQRFTGGMLPALYEEFLLYFGAPVSFDKSICFKPIQTVPICRRDGTLPLEVLRGLGDGDFSLSDAIKVYSGRLPPSMLPIGDLAGGNLLCMDVQKPTRGRIYCWNHEVELDVHGGRNSPHIQFTLAAKDFGSLLRSLKPVPDTVTSKTLTELGIDTSRSWLDI